MSRAVALGTVFMGVAFAAFACGQAPDKGVQVIADGAHHRVDITIDGKPFTSYIWPASLKKPVLYPLIDEDGVTVTRGYPLELRAGERVDHPHHAGLWFNYGNVNGFDFWNNSDAITPADAGKMGTVHQLRVVEAKSGPERGELVTESAWIAGDGRQILTQTTHYTFSRQGHARIIDLTATLTAQDHLVFRDDKEGLLGIRVARWLESPDEKGGVFTDANGNATEVAPAQADSGAANPATGAYLTSEGAAGGAAWGTRGRWCALTGHTGDHTDQIAIFDHPGNPGYPTYWHARGYGLFAANPLGRSIFDPKQPKFDFTLEKGQSATFQYRIVIDSRAETAGELNREADAFAAEKE